MRFLSSKICTQIWLPLPPTISVDENEVYNDRSLKYLYETTPIPEHLLPPIYLRKEKKKIRLEQPNSNVVNESTKSFKIQCKTMFFFVCEILIIKLHPSLSRSYPYTGEESPQRRFKCYLVGCRFGTTEIIIRSAIASGG